jgi:excisionase family DNA binding protein
MRTLDLDEAADWLKCDPETVRTMAASGELPAAKVGRAWVFVDVDLVDWLRSKYNACRSTKTRTPKTGTPPLRSQASPDLDAALALPARRRPNASTTHGLLNSNNVVTLEKAGARPR